MTSFIHCFNPQNDLALANGSAYFTPPKSAVDLCVSGACLPIWYGNPGDFFFGSVKRDWFEATLEAFDRNILPRIYPRPDDVAMPWGWSPAQLHYFRKAGFAAANLPSEQLVDRWRQLAGREVTAPVLAAIIKEESQLTCCENELLLPRLARTEREAFEHIEKLGVAMLKLPWSGSGRGQQVTDRTTRMELIRRISGMIARQGAIEVSPYYKKKLDFAMLWKNGEFVGYSLFTTDSHGGWLRNILFSDVEIENVIQQQLARPFDFGTLRERMTAHLGELSKKYSYDGPFGVDFIVADPPEFCRERDHRMIIPVEINVRHTMGHVAHAIRDNILDDGVAGIFEIRQSSEIKEPYYHIKQSCPNQVLNMPTIELNGMPVVRNHRLVEGSLDLVPPGGAFRFLLRTSSSDGLLQMVMV